MKRPRTCNPTTPRPSSRQCSTCRRRREPEARDWEAKVYDLAYRFFRRLSTVQAELPGGVALANLKAPLLLANAAWYPVPGHLGTLAAWYAERDLGAALVAPVPKDEALERSLREGPFALERHFSLFDAWAMPLAAEGNEAPSKETGVVVEQVGWAQARMVGNMVAARYELPAYGAALGATLAAAMQEDPNVLAFVAYREGAVGAMVAFAHEGSLTAMLQGWALYDCSGPLRARLYDEALSRNLSPCLLEPLDERQGEEGGSEVLQTLELWTIR